MKGIKNQINKYKFKLGQNRSGATVLEFNGKHATKVRREDGVELTKGDKVLFRTFNGEKMGPWTIKFFNIYDNDRVHVEHCSALFDHSTTYCLSVGLLEKIK